MAKKFSNTYSVGIFACCREIYRPSKHCGLFGGSNEEAYEHYKRIVLVQLEAERAESVKAKE